MKCKICNGTGILEIGDDSEYNEDFCECGNCNGTGFESGLKPCPCCGSELKGSNLMYIYCTFCYAKGPKTTSEASAKILWNGNKR
jgi:hypothetical protein